MKAPDESGMINKDFTEKSTDWIATDGKRCTDVDPLVCVLGSSSFSTDPGSDVSHHQLPPFLISSDSVGVVVGIVETRISPSVRFYYHLHLSFGAPGASHSVTGLASWYMGSGFSVGGAVVFVYLTSVRSLTSPP